MNHRHTLVFVFEVIPDMLRFLIKTKLLLDLYVVHVHYILLWFILLLFFLFMTMIRNQIELVRRKRLTSPYDAFAIWKTEHSFPCWLKTFYLHWSFKNPFLWQIYMQFLWHVKTILCCSHLWEIHNSSLKSQYCVP